jgi:hypothetical protein
VGLNSLKSLNLTNVYPNNNKNNNKKNNKVKSKPLELRSRVKIIVTAFKILTMRATNIREPRGVRVAGIFNSI